MADPVINMMLPVGSDEDPDVAVSFRVFDSDADTDTSTLDLTFTSPSATIPVIVNGVFQPGYTGTIVTVTTITWVTLIIHPLFEVGGWQATAYVEDALGGSVTDSWNWSVVADTPEVSNKQPNGVTTGELNKLSVTITDTWGIDVSSINWSVEWSPGNRYDYVTNGVINPLSVGQIIEIDDPGTGPRHVEIIVHETIPPDSEYNGRLYTFALDAESIVGVSI